MNTHLLFLATANHSRHVGARLIEEIDLRRETDTAIKTTMLLAREFRLAIELADGLLPPQIALARKEQLKDRCRTCLSMLADVEQALMLATGER